MKVIKNKSFISFASLFVTLFLIEAFFKYISGLNIFTFSLVRTIISSILLASFISFFTSRLKSIHTYIINEIITFISSFYVWLQIGFNNYLSMYMSFKSTSQLGAVQSYIKEFLLSMKPKFYLIFIPFLILTIFYVFLYIITKKKEASIVKIRMKYRYEKIIAALSLLVTCILSCILYNLTLNPIFDDKRSITSSKELFISGGTSSDCIKNFGILAYGYIDFKTRNIDITNMNLLLSYSAKSEKKDYTRKIDDTSWEELISIETDETLNVLNNYYINSSITSENDYTGKFKNKNLIIIMMESVNDIIINKEYFPNFYKMYSEGWSFDNNYSPRNGCATGNNEFSSLTGLYSVPSICTMNIYVDNTYPESLFNLFNNQKYITNSFHDFNEQYYERSIAHPNMGVRNYYNANDLNMDYTTSFGDWASDEELIEKYLEIIDSYNGKSFMSYITTVSPHLPYTSSSPYGDMYLDMTENESYSMEMRRYLSKLKVTDNALGILLEGLEERGILDDTVIVLFGDHYPYGMSEERLKEVLTRDLNNYEIEKTPLVIYNSETKGKKYDTYTSYINLTPTLANLFDLDYDPRLYTGVDIFDKDYNNIVAFADYSWKNNLAYYDAQSGKVEYYTDFTYTDEEIKAINNEIYAKMNASTLSIKNNYFEYLYAKTSKK